MDISRRRLLQGTAGAMAALAGGRMGAGAEPALAAGITCPHPNPIVNENRCTDPATWGDEFRLASITTGFGGYATQTSYDLSALRSGGSVGLRLFDYDQGSAGAQTGTSIRVYRLGYYGGRGGRLTRTQSVSGQQPGTGAPAPDKFAYRRAPDSWGSASIPGSAFPQSGVYLIKLVREPNGTQAHVVVVVRDDARTRDLLVVMPTNTWQAYNNYFDFSMYFSNSYGSPPADAVAGIDPATTGTRAVKVSFDRPHSNYRNSYDWVLHTEFALIFWLEQMGYDLAYADDLLLHSPGTQLQTSKTRRALVLAGHNEYWTQQMRDNVLAARNAKLSIASFSANSAYWRVRFEDSDRTMVCFKTREGEFHPLGAGTTAGSRGVNDYGPGQAGQGSAASAVGPDLRAGTPDDNPLAATTSYRDPGAAPGTPDAPDDGARGHGRVGAKKALADAKGQPENELFGVLYVGADTSRNLPLRVPAGNASGEFAAHRAWRRTGIGAAGVTIPNLVGWEWDAVPNPASALYNAKIGAVGRQPAGVKRLTASPIPSDPTSTWLLDEGRNVGQDPPPGQPREVNAVMFKVASGAQVFSSGTMQWSWGLGPHYLHTQFETYEDPPTNSTDPRIQQATYNVLADMGAKPGTPEGVTLDSTAKPKPQPNPQPQPKPAPRDAVGPALALSGSGLVMGRNGRVKVRISAPEGEERDVEARVSLKTARRVKVGPGRARSRGLGSRTFEVDGGSRVTVHVRVPVSMRRYLKRRRVSVEVRVAAKDAAGNKTVFRRARRLRGWARRSPR